MKNIGSINNCYGCGVCCITCPQKIINLSLNSEGFYIPSIKKTDECISCGLCISVCSYLDDKPSQYTENQKKFYAGWSNNKITRYNCSSGGIGFEIGKYFLSKSYKVCGVKYNLNLNRAEHYISNTEEELIHTIGSKYIQSYTLTGFSQFNKADKYLVIGSPCQIDSLRRYIKTLKIEDNFFLIDFLCHGVPSMLLWNKYIDMVKLNLNDITNISWRNKIKGWHDSWKMEIDGVGKNSKESFRYQSWMTKGDLFYKFFLGDCILGKACYNKCKYKMDSSSADIRIGDLWGNKYKSDEEGVSAVIVFTEKGDEIVSNIENCFFKSEAKEIVLEGQMKESPEYYRFYNILIKLFQTNLTLKNINYFFTFINLLYRIKRKIIIYLKRN